VRILPESTKYRFPLSIASDREEIIQRMANYLDEKGLERLEEKMDECPNRQKRFSAVDIYLTSAGEFYDIFPVSMTLLEDEVFIEGDRGIAKRG